MTATVPGVGLVTGISTLTGLVLPVWTVTWALPVLVTGRSGMGRGVAPLWLMDLAVSLTSASAEPQRSTLTWAVAPLDC